MDKYEQLVKRCEPNIENIDIKTMCSSKIATFGYDLQNHVYMYDELQCGTTCCLNDEFLTTRGELFCGSLDSDGVCQNKFRDQDKSAQGGHRRLESEVQSVSARISSGIRIRVLRVVTEGLSR